RTSARQWGRRCRRRRRCALRMRAVTRCRPSRCVSRGRRGAGPTWASHSTDASGLAAVGSWTLGPTVGPNTLTASVPGLSAVTFTATGTAGGASSIVISAGDNQSAPVGTVVGTRPAVLVRDQFNNPVANVAVTFAVASGGGSVTGASQLTNANGLATLGSWTLGTSPGSNTLTATASGPAIAGNPVTFTATGTAGSASSIVISAGDNQNAPVGTAVGTRPAVLVRDQFNNPVANVAVTFAVASGGGSVTGASQTTDASGVATAGSWTLGPTAGPNTLTAT